MEGFISHPNLVLDNSLIPTSWRKGNFRAVPAFHFPISQQIWNFEAIPSFPGTPGLCPKDPEWAPLTLLQIQGVPWQHQSF